MTRDDVIRMALECGLLDARDDMQCNDGIAQFIGTLADFAELVVQKERESCATMLDDMVHNWYEHATTPSGLVAKCSASIRARGNK